MASKAFRTEKEPGEATSGKRRRVTRVTAVPHEGFLDVGVEIVAETFQAKSRVLPSRHPIWCDQWLSGCDDQR